MKLVSKQSKYVKEFDSSNGGARCMLPMSDFIKLPVEIGELKETKIFRCYDSNYNLLGEIRPYGKCETWNIEFK